MKTIKFKLLVLSIIFFAFIAESYSQNVFRLLSESSSLKITGTSSIHDWEMDASNFDSEALLHITPDNTIFISQVEFSCPVTGISSGNKIMDNKTYKALKEEKHPLINFIIGSQNNLKLTEDNNRVSGLLTIAGKTKQITFPCDVVFKSSERFIISGEAPLKMSDFDIEPPTAMLGALKTGDKVVVKFDFEFNINTQELTRNR